MNQLSLPIQGALLCQSTPDEQQHLEHLAELCLELWNTGVRQRSNKYSWGKADATTQLQELQSLRTDFPEYAEIAPSALEQVILQLDRAYRNFLGDLSDFKAKKRKAKPLPPQLLNSSLRELRATEQVNAWPFALCFAPEDYRFEAQIWIKQGTSGLQLSLPEPRAGAKLPGSGTGLALFPGPNPRQWWAWQTELLRLR